MTAKQDEKLDLRAAPGRKLVRFKKGVVIGGAAIASAGILGVTMLALQTPSLRQGLPTGELYNTDRKPTPDGLDRKSTRLNSSHYCAARMPSSARKKKQEQQKE